MIQFNARQNSTSPSSSSNWIYSRSSSSSSSSYVTSCIFVIITQFALISVPYICPNFSLITHLPLSVVVLAVVAVLGKCCRRISGFYASAPAMVFMNVLFVWVVYIVVIRRAHFSSVDLLLYGAITSLIYGLRRIMSTDPGFVIPETPRLNADDAGCELVKLNRPAVNISESSMSLSRIRYCKICKAYIKGFDHHCPAFGNCIGQNNHLLFVALLIGFVTVEAIYAAFSSCFLTETWISDEVDSRVYHYIWWYSNFNVSGQKLFKSYSTIAIKLMQTIFSRNLAMSTMTFSLLQVIWQVVFLAWHVYCVCYNIKTDEWINWKKYPEFQCHVQAQHDETLTETRFTNPYNNGIITNLKEFLTSKN